MKGEDEEAVAAEILNSTHITEVLTGDLGVGHHDVDRILVDLD